IPTMGTNAFLAGDNIINFWRRMIHTPEAGVYTTGFEEPDTILAEHWKDCNGFVLDILGILTLYMADGVDVLKAMGKDCLVTRSTWELLESDIDALTDRMDETSLSVDFEGDRLVKIEITPEEKQAQLDRFQKLVDSLREFITIIDPPLSEDFSKKRTFDEVLGRSFVDAMAVAGDRGYWLFSDDPALRKLATERNSLRCISTISMVSLAEKVKVIDHARLNDIFVQLIRCNYRSVPVNPQIMMQVLIASEYSVKFPFTQATDLLEKGLVKDVPAVVLVVRFLQELFLNCSVVHTRTLVLQFLLQRLFAGRNRVMIRLMLIRALQLKFNLLPIQLEEIMAQVNLWV
ncbi:MAG TPA: hypothetical protein VK518_21705, partial [Puia sp.]|nr:hypothetical protein [Puia sp.]